MSENTSRNLVFLFAIEEQQVLGEKDGLMEKEVRS
jgi:hypothetical protein